MVCVTLDTIIIRINCSYLTNNQTKERTSMEILTMVSLICGILASVGAIIGVIFKFVIINPLKVSIDNLTKVVETILKDIETGRVDRYNQAIRLTSIESDVRHLDSRMESIEESLKGR